MTFAILCAGAMEMLAYNICFHTSLPNLHSRISYIYYQAWLYVWEGKTFSVWLSLALFNYIFKLYFPNVLLTACNLSPAEFVNRIHKCSFLKQPSNQHAFYIILV